MKANLIIGIVAVLVLAGLASWIFSHIGIILIVAVLVIFFGYCTGHANDL